MAYNFSKVNTTGKEYKKLGELYLEDPNLIYPVNGLYIQRSHGKYGEIIHPVCQSTDYNINLPKHLTQTVERMLADPDCVIAIRNGECGIQIYEYQKEDDPETYYSVNFVNV